MSLCGHMQLYSSVILMHVVLLHLVALVLLSLAHASTVSFASGMKHSTPLQALCIASRTQLQLEDEPQLKPTARSAQNSASSSSSPDLMDVGPPQLVSPPDLLRSRRSPRSPPAATSLYVQKAVVSYTMLGATTLHHSSPVCEFGRFFGLVSIRLQMASQFSGSAALHRRLWSQQNVGAVARACCCRGEEGAA